MTIEYDGMPDYVELYTKKSIPTSPSEDEIDEWLAVVPDLLEFWERQVAQKRLDYEMQEFAAKQALSFAYVNTDEGLAVKNRENLASCDKAVVAANQLAMQKKYELNVVQAVYSKVEAKGKSIHKIATMRVRRLEQGIAPVSVTSKNPNTPKPKPDRNGIVWSPKPAALNKSDGTVIDMPVKSVEVKEDKPTVTTVKPDKVSRIDGGDVINREINQEVRNELYKDDEVF